MIEKGQKKTTMREKKIKVKKPSRLHPRNKHQGKYDFEQLMKTNPALSKFVRPNKHGDTSVDFADPAAVRALNKSLLMHHYGVKDWQIPEGYLCPPIPGRADYLHHIADFMGRKNKEVIPFGPKIKCLDIGVGANCIYPIIGVKEYGWSFVGSEVDTIAIEAANQTLTANPELQGMIDLRLQANPKKMFEGIIKKDERFDLTICNPPFHTSQEEAQKSTLRKLKNLNKKAVEKIVLNFGGQSHELYYEGGEIGFVISMIEESKKYADSCLWFSTLISKESNVNTIQNFLKKVHAMDIQTIPMGQGNKKSRIIVWSFQKRTERRIWIRNWALEESE